MLNLHSGGELITLDALLECHMRTQQLRIQDRDTLLKAIEEEKMRLNTADDECEDYVIDITDLKDIINKHYSE